MHFLTSFLCETHLREIRETHSAKSGKVILESQGKSGKVREFELKSFVYTLIIVMVFPLNKDWNHYSSAAIIQSTLKLK